LPRVGSGAGIRPPRPYIGPRAPTYIGPRAPTFERLLPVVPAGALVAGCGGSSAGGSPPRQPEPTGRPADFPAADGRTVDDLASWRRGRVPSSAPASRSCTRVVNRFGLALFDAARSRSPAPRSPSTPPVTGEAACADHTSRALNRGRPQSTARRPPGTRAEPRLRGRGTVQAHRQAGGDRHRQPRRAPAGHERLQRQRHPRRRTEPPTSVIARARPRQG
jgi:hypothetical protein